MEKKSKTYKVNEVASLLGTNEETVRRWIRNNKLHASQQSKKIGNIIRSDDLLTFLRDYYPKYLERFMASTSSAAEKSTASLIAGLGISLLGAAGFSAVKMLREKNSFSQEDIVSYAGQQITKLEARIKQKRAAITELEEEIRDYEAQIENYQKILKMGGDEVERTINAMKNAGK